MKRCNKCHREKPRAEFGRDSSAKDGLLRRCKSCNREHVRRWRREQPASVEAGYRQRYQQRHSEKVRARRAVSNAVKTGKLTKPDRCDDCGEPTDPDLLDGHHGDYSKPLDVDWLCRACHADRHYERIG